MIVNNQKKLILFKKYFNKKKFICVDTEFERKKTYYSKLSIITISDGKKIFIFDILKYPYQINFLREVFKSNSKLKILHGGNQDIEIFLNLKINIEPFFDTQIASGFLGFDKNISYANLVRKFFNKNIDKTNQNKDWLKRPLTKSQISYLQKDVIYLKKIYYLQIKLLKKQKKINFINEEFNLLIKKIKKKDGINSKFKKKLGQQICKNINFLKLIKLRDKKGMEKNLPKNWIISDDDIIAMIKSKKLFSLKKNKFFEKKEIKILINLLNKIFKITNNRKYNEIEIKCLEFFKYLVSKKYLIDSNLIASKYDLYDYKIIRKNSSWRDKIFYKVFEEITKGKKKFVIKEFKSVH
tara:strand:+ start:3076 stop:4134 length:1059 start_codon:yes stop_codon:yes gene_type:complete